ncbi:MAG: hypothetical protein ACLPV8_25170 [Steroidobacteraceae bacterium]
MLSHLYLSAVLPCLADLAEQDPAARALVAKSDASISLAVLGGPGATVYLRHGRILWQNGSAAKASLLLLFCGERHLNAFFSGKKWAVPLPVWGGWRIGLLGRFAKLAAILEAVLNGDEATLRSAAGRRLHTRLSLIAAGLGLGALARGDPESQQALRSVPPGLAAFTIDGEARATVWFEHGSADCAAGWSDPPRRPDVTIAFANIDVAYRAMRDELDTMAAIGSGDLCIDGLIPLADGLNVVMERMRIYLQP